MQLTDVVYTDGVIVESELALFLPYLRNIARRVHYQVRDERRTGTVDDLVQQGVLALLRLIARYNGNKRDAGGATFRWYIHQRVPGAMFDSFRKRGHQKDCLFIDYDEPRDNYRNRSFDDHIQASYKVHYDIICDIRNFALPANTRDADIVQRAIMGEDQRALAKEYAITESRVCQIMREWYTTARAMYDDSIKDDDMKAPKGATEEMLERYRYGLFMKEESKRHTYASIGKDYGLSGNAVYARLKHFDLTPRDKHYNEHLELEKKELVDKVTELQDELNRLRRKLANARASLAT